MRKKILSLFVIICILLLANFITFGVKASGKVSSETRSLSKFYSVRLNCNGIVNITQGSTQMVIVKTDDNIFPNIQTEVSKGELIISITGIVTNITTLEIDIVMDNITNLTVNSPGRIDVKNDINVKNINLYVIGNGNLTLNINTEFIYSKLLGTGNLVISGKTLAHEIDINGTGFIDSSKLSSDKIKILISNGGKCKADVKEEINLNINLGGELEYKGTPKINAKISGAGTIAYKE